MYNDTLSHSSHSLHTPGPLLAGPLDRNCNAWVMADKGVTAIGRVTFSAGPERAKATLALLAAAYTSYDAVCGPLAIEAAESNLLTAALAALRQLYQWSVAEGPAWGRDDNADDARRNARTVLARIPGGPAK